MLRSLLSLIFITTLLFGASSQSELDAAKKNLYSSSKENQFKAYDTYKRHYIKALINGDVATQKRCLDGICIAGEKLHIDVREYREKRDLMVSDKNPASPGDEADESVTEMQIERIDPVPPSDDTVVKIRSQHALSGFNWEGNALVLNFDFKLNAKDVNYFQLRPEGKTGYRYIFRSLGCR